MKITIGGIDYTAHLDAAHPLTIERKLNEPSACRLWITLPSGVSRPLRSQSIQIAGDDGTFYFTGYVAATPLPEYAGLGIEGPCYRFAIEAISDEYLLDQNMMAPGQAAAGETAGNLVASLVAKTGLSALSTQSLSLDAPVSSFTPEPGATFSATVARVANEARASYRALNGELALSTIPVAVHPLAEADDGFTLANLSLTPGMKRNFANDITVCGEHEPTTYVTEYFAGDGVTSQFYLADRPYTPPASRATVIRELFNESEIDTRVWSNSGSHGCFSLGAGGLKVQGGTGRDGDSELTWLDQVEMGGTLLLEASGVTLGSGSTGVLAGFFTGDQMQHSCVAGFQVAAQQGSGAVLVQPLVLGSAMGAACTIDSANQYTLRLRVHCPECERNLAFYRAFDDDGAVITGGESSAAPAKLQLEVQEYVNGVASMPVTLYEGEIANLPAACKVVAASSISLSGTMRALNLMSLGSGWVVSTPSGGGPVTRRVGTAAQSAECRVESSGTLVFYPGFAPAVGEQIAVSHRISGRSVGRSVNSASQQALSEAGLPAVSAWIGTVTSPATRSSRDCRNAAEALARAAASSSALWSGNYACIQAELKEDVWPGDALQLDVPSVPLNAQVIVRNVKLTYLSSCPDVVRYAISFANDWAEELAIRTSGTVPADAWLPVAISPTYPPNLNCLSASIRGNIVTVNTGASAPDGGGFEIRRRDNAFMTGTDSELVMRGSQSTMSFARVSASDRFYIRMYDGSNPPNYSEFSAALIFNVPLTA